MHSGSINRATFIYYIPLLKHKIKDVHRLLILALHFIILLLFNQLFFFFFWDLKQNTFSFVRSFVRCCYIKRWPLNKRYKKGCWIVAELSSVWLVCTAGGAFWTRLRFEKIKPTHTKKKTVLKIFLWFTSAGFFFSSFEN